MAFKYMNSGLVSLLYNGNAATQYTGYEYSNTGYAFTQVTSRSNVWDEDATSLAGMDLPNFQKGDEIWAKFDVYVPAISTSSVSTVCHLPRANKRKVLLQFYSNGTAVFSATSVTYTQHIAFDALGIIANATNSFVIHAIYDVSNTTNVEIITPNGEKFSLAADKITYSDTYGRRVYLYSQSSRINFSNVIVSNEEISPREQVIALPASTTTTNMATMAGGMYIADAANQTLLQSVDVNSLIGSYGASSQITGIQVVGNPAYRTGTGLANMIGLSKSGNTITEHGTCAVGTASTAWISDNWGLSGVTLGNIQNMQFGWRVGE